MAGQTSPSPLATAKGHIALIQKLSGSILQKDFYPFILFAVNFKNSSKNVEKSGSTLLLLFSLYLDQQVLCCEFLLNLCLFNSKNKLKIWLFLFITFILEPCFK
jgi:hypothetical protein